MTSLYRSVGVLSVILGQSGEVQALSDAVDSAQRDLRGTLLQRHRITDRIPVTLSTLATQWRGLGSETEDKAKAEIELATATWIHVATAVYTRVFAKSLG